MIRTRLNRVLINTASITKDFTIRLSFAYDLHLLTELRAIEGRKYMEKDNKSWTIPMTLENCFFAKKWKFQFSAELKEWANNEYIHRTRKVDIKEIPGLKGDLFPYQKDGVAFLERMNGRGLIADEMGLGKTIQALAWLQLHKEQLPAIIICPSSLKYNWAQEIRNWTNFTNIQILSGTGKKIEKPTGDILIINFDIIPNDMELLLDKEGNPVLKRGKPVHVEIPKTGWIEYLLEYKARTLIIDEIHYLKNDSALRTKAIKRLSNIPNIIALSGTPIESKPAEIYNTVHMIDPSVFPNKWSFLHRYCAPKNNGFGWVFNGATNVQELHSILTKKIMIRRLKKAVLQELPDKIFSFVPLEITNRKEYTEAESDFVEYVMKTTEAEIREAFSKLLKEDFPAIEINDHKLERLKEEKAKNALPIVQIEILKQLAAKGKLNASIDWVSEFLESGEKLVVFCEHRFIIDALMDKFKKIAVKVDGSVSASNRQKAMESFQNNEKIRLFVGNKAAEAGLTLTAASNIVLLEYPWTPGKLKQRIDRIHRIGQKESVNVYYHVGLKTIDEKIALLLDTKAKTVSNVLDGKEMIEDTILTDLINSFKK